MIELNNVLEDYHKCIIEGETYLNENGLKLKDDYILSEFVKAYMKTLEIIDQHNAAESKKYLLNEEELRKLNENVLIFKQMEHHMDNLIIGLKEYIERLKKDDELIEHYKEGRKLRWHWLGLKIAFMCWTGWMIAKYLL